MFGLLAVPVTAQAGVFTTPSGLSGGDHYRLIFARLDKTLATSTDIATYNAFANAEAALNTLLPSTTWSALVSTRAVNAVDDVACAGACAIAPILESVRKVYLGLQSLLSIIRMDANRRNATAILVRFSKSFASRRHRFSQASVRSTTQRFGMITNPFVWSERFTISTESCGITVATADANCGP